ncbi:MAG: hypothetical protein ACTHKV_01820 [Flavipsychrobacter sp.]
MKLTLAIFFLLVGSTIAAQTSPSRVGLLIYQHGSSKLTVRSKEKLESLYLAMLAYPNELVSISSTFGYVDEDEGELYNERILGVIDHMNKKYGLARTRFYIKGYEEGDKDVVLFRLYKPVYVEDVSQRMPR